MTGLSQNTPFGVSFSKKNPHLHSVNSGVFSPKALPEAFCDSPMTQRLSGFSLLEFMLMMTIVGMIIMSAGPSFYGVFKRHFLSLNTAQMIQELREVQSKSFSEHAYYKLQFDSTIAKYSVFRYSSTDWVTVKETAFSDHQFTFESGITSSQALVYDPNGNAYICLTSDTLATCLLTPLLATAHIKMNDDALTTDIMFLPPNGYVSSNYRVE
jgi:type II secretory pathway pseudopilin PulG